MTGNVLAWLLDIVSKYQPNLRCLGSVSVHILILHTLRLVHKQLHWAGEDKVWSSENVITTFKLSLRSTITGRQLVVLYDKKQLTQRYDTLLKQHIYPLFVYPDIFVMS